MTNGSTDAAYAKTIAEIAAATGFSRTTVRFVINGQAERYRIKSETKKVIEDYVAAHGVAISHVARSLRTRRTDAIGLIVPDLANAFFASLTAELEIHCRRSGRVLLTASSQEDPEQEATAIAGLVERGIDGIVIAPCRSPGASRLSRAGRRLAVVVVDRAFPGSAWPTVVGDNAGVTAELTASMIATAAGAVHFLCACPDLPSIADRIVGFSQATAKAGFAHADRLIRTHASDTTEAGRALMRGFFGDGGRPPLAFICSSLLILEGALQEIVAAMGRLPPELLIGTFDYHPLLDAVPNRILSVRQDEKAIAEKAFDYLVAQMDGRPAQPLHVVVPGRIVNTASAVG